MKLELRCDAPSSLPCTSDEIRSQFLSQAVSASEGHAWISCPRNSDGRLHLKEQGIRSPPQARGGVTHEYWRHVLTERLGKKGYAVAQEYDVGNGQAVDLHAMKHNQELFIEIETGKSDIKTNIEKCKRLKGRVVFFFINETLSAINPLPTSFLCLTPQDLERHNPF